VFAIERTNPKTSAQINPSTEKPGTTLAASKISNAFKTSAKRPNVRIVIGRVRISRMGLRMAFIIPNTKAKTIADVKLATCTPGRI